MTFEAFIIAPPKRKTKLRCALCKIEYASKDYSILFKSKKIIYFNFSEKKEKKIVCHDCLYSIMREKKTKNEEVELILIDSKGKKYICKFD